MKTEHAEYIFLAAARAYLPAADEEIIMRLGTKETTADDPRRLQVNATTYLLPPQLLYHSCEPNAYIDWKTMTVKPLRAIVKGDIITYHYGTSEWDYEIGAFACTCGSKLCVNYFRGFAYMLPEQQYAIRPYISDYIRSVWPSHTLR